MMTLAVAMLAWTAMPAQTPVATSVHGHIQNDAGVAMSGGDVKISTELAPPDLKTITYKYDFAVDSTGDYKGELAPGTYLFVYFKDGLTVDYFTNQKIVANTDNKIDFDMTRQEYLDKLTPEQKQQLEQYKKQIASTQAENSKISNLNQLLQQARDAKKNKDYDTAANLMQQAVTAKPDEGLLWFELGDAQTGQKKYADAVTSYQKAISLNDAAKKPLPELDSATYNNMGQAQANSGDSAGAATSYEAAAKLQPANAGMYFSNEAAILFNKGDITNALTAADKAIAADPTRPDPYFIRGQSLIQSATVDKSGKIIAPPGCVDAYQKYLDLAPDGPHAQDVKDVLTSLGETIHSSYKAPKSK